ncbi:HAD family hydrolase [Photobacterium proteolyticum]|uniref:HAD family hydrolase n=1 Tax=Photobacterium proteolyticum TaxID=1903952 RepID=A0A1Q9GK07_9GAMM|nr:HAD hydrolase-like protein [Photobacterium proteolyticum]OLQ74836.1 HAD family hydrolase [Photobacterium proteolyticum]
MSYEWLIFDLDGTISDPKLGIVRSFNFALEHYGFVPQSEADIAAYIGPPLDQTFVQLTGNHDPLFIEMIVAKYRERYAEVGYSENHLYPDMKQVLLSLKEKEGCRLGVCTSKRADFAEKILAMFGLLDVFEFVSGGDIGIEKWQQLEAIRQAGTISQNAVMIGDRAVDLTAAQHNKLDSAGVLWGYGSRDELEQASPTHLFDRPEQLLELLG